jgi:NAD(P)-dependent dehydrogenase (short-subunit alcohol dehydrogenase family)
MKSKTRRQILVGSAATLTGLAVAGVTSANQTNAQQSTPVTTPARTAGGRFTDKVVLITGATSGIGRATALAFAREGAKVVFCGRRVTLGEQVAREIKQAGGEALYVRADVLKSADIEALVATTVNTYGRLDIAFNNAGVISNAPIHETPEEEWDRIVNTNLKGMWLSMKYELPQMLKQNSGVIVNNSSMHAFSTRAGASPYAASKHGILGVTKAVALEVGPSGIRVNAVAPGPIDTPMLRAGIGATPEGRARFAETTGLKRIGRDDEIAQAVLWLSSDESAYITGTSLLIDGGTVASL